MHSQLEHLIQHFEQITQQLKALELIFVQSCQQNHATPNLRQSVFGKADAGILFNLPKSSN